MSKENTSLHQYLSDKIENTKYILELLDLGNDITNSRFLGKTDIIDLCNQITIKINKIIGRKEPQWCYGKADIAMILPCYKCDKEIRTKCFKISFYENIETE